MPLYLCYSVYLQYIHFIPIDLGTGCILKKMKKKFECKIK